MIRKGLLFILFAFIVVVLWNWSLVWYALNQGMGQFKIIWQARPIEEVLKDPTFPDSLKAPLRVIGEIREFAIDSLGLNDTDNYKTLYDQRGDEIMWVVTACEPYSFQPKVWDFPILGEVPYKGFFDKDKAVRLAEQLQAEGWDVGLRNPGGWSTLGWFTDPILSGMLDRSEGDLASLIIHEMVHATLYVKDSTEFNENLATFIGDSAAYDFLAHKYGRHSKEYDAYQNLEQDHRRYSLHILRGYHALDSLYHAIQDEADELKKIKKQKMIERIVDTMDTLTLVEFKSPSARFRERYPNNDYFMNYRRYQDKLKDFRKELDERYAGNLKEMIRDYTHRFPHL